MESKPPRLKLMKEHKAKVYDLREHFNTFSMSAEIWIFPQVDIS